MEDDERTYPCPFCGKELQPDVPQREIFGDVIVGFPCDACYQEMFEKRRVEILAGAGVPRLFLNKLPSLSPRPFPPEYSWVLIQGATGTGKSHKAVEYLLGAGDPRRVLFVDWPGFLDERKASIGSKTLRDPMELLRPFRGLLVIDDLGAETASPYTTETANVVLTHRYNECLRTVITTNLNNAKLEETYGVRITSRLAEVAKRETPKWKRDRRQKDQAA